MCLDSEKKKGEGPLRPSPFGGRDRTRTGETLAIGVQETGDVRLLFTLLVQPLMRAYDDATGTLYNLAEWFYGGPQQRCYNYP